MILRIIQYVECGKQSQEADEYVKDWYADQRRRLSGSERGTARCRKTLYNELGDKVTIYGIRDGYRGLIEGDYHEMLPEDFRIF